MGLACSGLHTLLRPRNKGVQNELLPRDASIAPAIVYEQFFAEVERQEAVEQQWFDQLQEWEAQGGWKVARGGGCVGLLNLKNTCWLNSGLQCLIHLRPLVERLLSSLAVGGNGQVDDGPVADDAPQIVETLRELLANLWLKRLPQGSKAVNPHKLHRALRHYAPWLVQGKRQQDAQEFLAYMLDAMHDELKLPLDPVGLNVEKFDAFFFEGEEVVEEYQAAWAWARHLIKSQSPLVDLFQGQLRSTLTCLDCGHTSKKFDAFMHLSIPVEAGVSTLSEALETFSSSENLEGDNQWFCELCRTRVDATKQMELYKLPPVVMLQLKRFSYNATARRVQKVPAQVELSKASIEQPINLDKYAVSRQRGEAVYDIVGVVNHVGNDADSGHYTAHCHHPVDGNWYSFDDKNVEQIDQSEAWLPKSAYVLFLVARKAKTAEQKRGSFNTQNCLIRPQNSQTPENWPHCCDLVGIRRQMQLFYKMPRSIDIEKLATYRRSYQRFRAGKGFGCRDEIAQEEKCTDIARTASGIPLPPALACASACLPAGQLAAIRSEYQKTRGGVRHMMKRGTQARRSSVVRHSNSNVVDGFKRVCS